MKATTIGIDLAKNVFQVHGVSEHGKVVLKFAFYLILVPEIIEDGANELPGLFRQLVQRLMDHLKALYRQVAEIDAEIKAWHRQSDLCRKLEKIPGIGPVTATALVATIGDAKHFENGRQLAAWLGLVPRQHSSGGKQNLLGISKRGDRYLRTLLIHCARSVILSSRRKGVQQGWVHELTQRRNHNVAAVALANKIARTVWALWAHDREFRSDYTPAIAAA
jgi:transposase